jgi:hypothetical protein
LSDVRIVVGDIGVFFPELYYDLYSRRFPNVIHVSLVGYAQEKYICAVETFLGVVERYRDLGLNDVGHVIVYVCGDLNEPGRKVDLFGLPGQIERIDWNAVSAQARTGIEWHEPIGFGARRIYHLPDVDVEAITQEC